MSWMFSARLRAVTTISSVADSGAAIDEICAVAGEANGIIKLLLANSSPLRKARLLQLNGLQFFRSNVLSMESPPRHWGA